MFFTRRLKLWLALGLISSSVLATRDVVVRATDYARFTYSPATSWVHAASTALCGADYMYSDFTRGATLTFQFTGIAIYVGLVRFASGSRALIEIDGVQQTTIDTYLASTDCYTPPFFKTGLADAQHTLRITDLTTNITARWLRFDSVTYTEYTPEERASFTASISAASASAASTASKSPAAPTSTSTASSQAEKKLNVGIIVGGAVGGVVGLALLLGLGWFLLRRDRPNQPQGSSHSHGPQLGYAEKSELTPYQLPGQPYQPQMTAPSSMANFAAHPAGALSYNHSGGTTTNISTSSPYSSQPQSPQSLYADRPMSQYSTQEAQNMASMVADIVTSRMQNPGTLQAPIPEPMDITSRTGRQASPIAAKGPGTMGGPFP